MSKVGILLINLGSPADPSTGAVRRYLREFLMDARVIDVAAPARFLLVNGIIAPFRSPKSAHAYQKIWTKEGSPLVTYGRGLQIKVQALLGDDYLVRTAMRYGEPSIPSQVKVLLDAEIEELRVFPLYPHYASASVGSSVDMVMQSLSQEFAFPPLRILPDFYEDPRFIQSFTEVAAPRIKALKPDHVLFSYHGLPERQLTKSMRNPSVCKFNQECCASVRSDNRLCYRAQCYATTRALVKSMGLKEGEYSTSFQSRLGRAAWIKPYTDEVFAELREKGVKRLAVMCPAFVADCLETLEEIGMRGAEDWQTLGGEKLELIPSLNLEDVWCRAVADMVKT
jgi:ferrochelatase